jgi:hypothetical protein
MKKRILHTLTILSVILSISAWGAVESKNVSRAGVIAVEQDIAQEQAKVNAWKEATLAKNLSAMTKGMTCKDANHPFLTNKVVVSNDIPNLEWMTFDEALNSTGYTVVAYCN